jgi:dipeptidyl aminopeptidase/acylaminoacyl peptidase
LAVGPGRYSRLTWNDAQTKLAFFRSEPLPEPAATPPAGSPPTPPAETTGARVFLWDRTAGVDMASVSASQAVASAAASAGSSPAAEVLGPSAAGLKSGWGIVERGGLSFSADGKKLSVATAPLAKPTPTPPTTSAGSRIGRTAVSPPAEDKVDLDLWSWKDDAIQPMQKVRANVQRNKTYRAVYFLDTREFRQLSTDDVDVSVPAQGDWGLATNDKAYRGQLWLSPSPRDTATINVRTGETRPAFVRQGSPVFRSPKGRFLAAFDGKDWQLVSVPDGAKRNLTATVPSKFGDEDFDAPTTRPAHGLSGWTPDEKYVLLNDRYDIWKVATDGSGAENLTRVGRKQSTRLRIQRLGASEPDADPGIDLSKPQFLVAENLDTRDAGFYRLPPGRDPVMLVMGARRYTAPVKAKYGDTLLFTAQSFFDPPDYFTADPDFREVKRVTDSNPQKAGLNWGRAELVRYHSADGVPLSGVLVKPEDFDPSKKYPMIVYIYERLSQNLHQFRPPTAGTSINPTYYASNGYLVLMPDIAYTVGSPGQSALKCVLPAVQAVVDKGYVDEKAIGIQGHSWGGYQAAYLITQTGRFKAAAAGAPVSDMVSAYGGIRWGTGLPRQFQYEHTQSRIGATLWQAPMKFVENSPIFMADRVSTPLLMLHNDGDDAVPWYQGIEYYLALRRLGKEVYLCNYPGEPHGLRKRANQKDYTMRMQQFFDHHLKGAPAPGWMTAGVPYLERDAEKEQWKPLFKPQAAMP